MADTEGAGQAKQYANKLDIRFTYLTNGEGIYQVDMAIGEERYVSQYPSPDVLWDLSFSEQSGWRDHFAAVPYNDRGGTFLSRYYQDTAIDRVLEVIAKGKGRILLTLATGTGKTFVSGRDDDGNPAPYMT